MRRKDREITDGEKIREIIEGCGWPAAGALR